MAGLRLVTLVLLIGILVALLEETEACGGSSSSSGGGIYKHFGPKISDYLDLFQLHHHLSGRHTKQNAGLQKVGQNWSNLVTGQCWS